MDGRRTSVILLMLLLFPTWLAAQSEIISPQIDMDKELSKRDALKAHHDNTVNWGVKVGLTSSLFLISDFVINGTRIDEEQNNYKLGYFVSVFMRINFDRHFLQPEVSYNINRCDISFQKPLPQNAPTGTIPEFASISSAIHSIDIPVIYGYNIIKQGPYSLAVFGGPKIRYILERQSEVSFNNFDLENIQEKLYPLNLSLTLGVAVTISRVFFDFRYDIGLHNMSKQITYQQPETGTDFNDQATDHEVRFHRRDNVLSFSLGVFF